MKPNFICSNISGNLTLSLTSDDGLLPSPTNPISIDFCSANVNTSLLETVSVTNEVSIVIPIGARLGVPNSNQPFKIWVVLFNDSGVVRLGVINAATGGQGIGNAIASFYPLKAKGIASTVLLDVNSDLTAVFYTADTNLVDKSYTVLGYFIYAGGLAPPGDWNITPSHVKQYDSDVTLPGQIEHTHVYERIGDPFTGTDTIQLYTTPLFSMGNTFIDNTITPKLPACVIRVRVGGEFTLSGEGIVVVALFRDTFFLGAIAETVKATLDLTFVTLERAFHYPGGPSTTITMKAGASTPLTTYFNSNTNPLFGGASVGAVNSYMIIEEVAM